MKRKGFLLIDTLVSIFIFSTIILSLIILMNKNIENIRNILNSQEKKRIVFNISNVIKRDFYMLREEKKYNLTCEENKFFLIGEGLKENIGKFRYLSLDKIKNIKLLKKSVILNDEDIGEMFFISLEIDNEKIEKVIEEKDEK